MAQEPDEPLLRDFIGINVHTVLFDGQDDNQTYYKMYSDAAKLVRDYHTLTWDTGSNTGDDTRFPWTGANNWINWDQMYGRWVAEGYAINPAIMFDGTAPGAWSDMAADSRKYGEALAKHFGPEQGNGLLTSIQIGNEPSQYSIAQYQTIFRNMAEGIRLADASVPIVSANVTAGPPSEYRMSVQAIFDSQAMIDLVDAFAIHTYPRVKGWPTYETSYPEDPRMGYLRDVQGLIDWRDANAPGKEIWITEFGYDATTKTPPSGSQWIGGVTDTQQAQYLVRSWLLFSAMDVERAYMFWFNDNDSPSQHGSAGLTRQYQPKPSLWATNHLQSTLGDFRFDRVVEQDPQGAYIYAYEHGEDTDQVIWVLWSPTGSGVEVEVVLEDLPGEILKAEWMPLAEGDALAGGYDVLAGGGVRVTVGESPLYLHMVRVPEPAAATVALLGAGALMRRRRPA